MRVFAVLILVSSLTFCSLPIKPNPEGSKYPKHIDCYCCQHYPFVSLWMFEQKWFAITERIKAKPIKKILMFY
jgi:hypothetical protein